MPRITKKPAVQKKKKKQSDAFQQLIRACRADRTLSTVRKLFLISTIKLPGVNKFTPVVVYSFPVALFQLFFLSLLILSLFSFTIRFTPSSHLF